MRQLKNVKTSLGQKEKSANTMIDKSGFMSFMFRKRKKKWKRIFQVLLPQVLTLSL